MTPHDEVILAITTLLVRNHKIVAVAASGVGVLAIQQPIETAMSEPDSADNEQPDTPLDSDETLDYHNVAVDRNAAVVNPRNVGHCCMLVNKGKSLLKTELIGDDVWAHFDAQR